MLSPPRPTASRAITEGSGMKRSEAVATPARAQKSASAPLVLSHHSTSSDLLRHLNLFLETILTLIFGYAALLRFSFFLRFNVKRFFLPN